MAYSKEQLSANLIGGSINWAPPGDKIPANDALEIRNFRADKPGQLVSRRGIARITGSPQTISNGKLDVHTLFRRPGQAGLIVGAGNSLFTDNGNSTITIGGGDGEPYGLAAMRGWLWIMNRGHQARFRPGVPNFHRQWFVPRVPNPPAPLAAVAVGSGGLEGDYYVAVSFEDDQGFEGAMSPVQGPITLAGQGIQVPLATAPDAWVSKRHVYIAGGTLQAGNYTGFWRAKTINNNTTTSTVIDETEDDITNIGIEGRFDFLSPVNALGGGFGGFAAGVVGPYYQRLIVYSSAANPNRYAWSILDDSRGAMPWAFGPNDYSDVGDLDSRIWWISLHRRAFVIYKEDSIWRVLGDPASANAVQEETNAQRGALGPRAIAKIGSMDAFGSADGIFTFDLDNERRISQKIDPIFKGDHVRPASGLLFPALTVDATARARSVLYYAQDLLHFSYPEQGESYPNITLLYNPGTGEWTRRQLASGVGSARAPRSMLYNPQNGNLYCGLRDGHLYGMDVGSNDNGQAIPLAYISHYHHQGAPDNDKVYEDLTLDYDTGGASITVKTLHDHGQSEVALGSLTSVGRIRRTFPLNLTQAGKGQRARNIALFLEGTATSEVKIYEATIHFRLERREGRSFDSGLTDLGDDRVKVLEALEMEVEAQNSIYWAIYGSLSRFGAGLIRDGVVFAPGPTRIPLPVNMTALVEGKYLQVVLSSSAEFRLHKMRLKLRPIGEYLVGQAGEFYDSGDVAIGA